MHIVSYNFCQGGADYEAAHRVLAELKPDILLAQELRKPTEYLQRARQTWRHLGYQDPIWHGVPAHPPDRQWGSAIFVRAPLVHELPVPPKLEGWVVGLEVRAAAAINYGRDSLKIFSIHTPTQRENNNYIRQAQEVLEFLASQDDGTAMIVGGDFNVTISLRNAAADTPNLPTEQEIIAYLRRSLGLVNCWQASNPHQPVPRTFHRTDQSRGHLDGIFVSASWYRYLVDCWVVGAERGDWTEGDHYPVVAAFSSDRPAFRLWN